MGQKSFVTAPVGTEKFALLREARAALSRVSWWQYPLPSVDATGIIFHPRARRFAGICLVFGVMRRSLSRLVAGSANTWLSLTEITRLGQVVHTIQRATSPAACETMAVYSRPSSQPQERTGARKRAFASATILERSSLPEASRGSASNQHNARGCLNDARR
jgi:hypothetical protein